VIRKKGRCSRCAFVHHRFVSELLLSDKNESYHFHTSRSTNKQGFGNLLRKTSPVVIKMWFKRNICEKSPVSFSRSGPRRIVSQVRAEASSLAFCRTPETIALANLRWSERSEWNLGYESQRIIAHRRCRLTTAGEKKHRGRWDASSKLPGHYTSPPHVCCTARGVPTKAASLMLTCIN
jgi:hypothetical protein